MLASLLEMGKQHKKENPTWPFDSHLLWLCRHGAVNPAGSLGRNAHNESTKPQQSTIVDHACIYIYIYTHIYIYINIAIYMCIFRALHTLLPEVADHGTASIHVAIAVVQSKKHNT